MTDKPPNPISLIFEVRLLKSFNFVNSIIRGDELVSSSDKGSFLQTFRIITPDEL